MITVTSKALTELCNKLSIKEKELVFIGGGREDSDGILYSYDLGKEKIVIKILAFPEHEQDKLTSFETRVKFANYLGENGINLSYPILNQNGNIYETCYDNKHIYTAYVMNYFSGRTLENDDLTDELVHDWGKIIGKSHKVTKLFQDKVDVSNFSYKDEISFFHNWCKEPTVKSAWKEIENYLYVLPKGRDDYGFIHNDNHQRNVLYVDGNLTLIDFDCSGCQFFIQDITTPVQGLMFDKTGGMISPVYDNDRLKRFFDHFISGYEKENHLDNFWYGEINNFINYRRVLLYTCMQDWIDTNTELKNGFIQNIINPPKIM